MRYLTLLLLLGLSACVTTRVIQIPEPYPKLKSADGCLAFFKRAALADDPAAGYYCLAESTKDQVTQSDFFTGWTWYREYFELFGRAEVVARRTVPPGELLTLKLLQLEEPFLFVQDPAGWRLRIPSHYNKRTLKELFTELKNQAKETGSVEQKTRPERRGG